MKPFILLAFFTSLLLASLPPSSTAPLHTAGFRIDLTRIDAGKHYSRSDLLRRAVDRSKTKAEKLGRKSLGPASVHPSQGEYIFDFAIGTPPVQFTGILDTGSDLIWTQCTTCIKCIPQPSPLFDPLRSASYSPLPCTHKLCRAMALQENSACAARDCFYHYNYGDGTDTIGLMAFETFTFGSTKKVSIPRIGFGCGLYDSGDISNSSGLFGFGRGPISLISQLGVRTFSYCFTDFLDDHPKTSPLFLGTLARLTGPDIRTTPLIRLDQSMQPYSSFYYVSLKAISVGGSLLSIPPEVFQVKKDGSGGMIIDSGTQYLMLEAAAYKQFVHAFRSHVKMRPINTTGTADFELCYRVKRPPSRFPALVFHFEGADWEMPLKNYMGFDEESGLFCLMVLESPGLSIFANVQTQNMHVLYNLEKNQLSFAPAKCEML